MHCMEEHIPKTQPSCCTAVCSDLPLPRHLHKSRIVISSKLRGQGLQICQEYSCQLSSEAVKSVHTLRAGTQVV